MPAVEDGEAPPSDHKGAEAVSSVKIEGEKKPASKRKAGGDTSDTKQVPADAPPQKAPKAVSSSASPAPPQPVSSSSGCGSGTGGGGGGGAGGGGGSDVVYSWAVEYAKSNRSTCQASHEKIDQGAVRIGKEVGII
jgi:hypothetical protein